MITGFERGNSNNLLWLAFWYNMHIRNGCQYKKKKAKLLNVTVTRIFKHWPLIKLKTPNSQRQNVQMNKSNIEDNGVGISDIRGIFDTDCRFQDRFAIQECHQKFERGGGSEQIDLIFGSSRSVFFTRTTPHPHYKQAFLANLGIHLVQLSCTMWSLFYPKTEVSSERAKIWDRKSSKRKRPFLCLRSFQITSALF